jgi:RNA polymerase sigma-70 factor (ECF subfamily)
VIRIVRSHPPVRAAEKDLAQEIFLKLFTRLNQYRERAGVPLQHWVSRLAVRTCLDASRAERRRPEWRWTDLSEEQSAWLEFSKFDRVVKPTPEQGARIQTYLDRAVHDLQDIRIETIARSSHAIRRLIAEVERELTPEQQQAFETMKPKPAEVTLDVLELPLKEPGAQSPQR